MVTQLTKLNHSFQNCFRLKESEMTIGVELDFNWINYSVHLYFTFYLISYVSYHLSHFLASVDLLLFIYIFTTLIFSKYKHMIGMYNLKYSIKIYF